MDHSVWSSMFGLIVNLLQLKFQGNGKINSSTQADDSATSPFETRPLIMLLALLWLLFYFLATSTASNASPSSLDTMTLDAPTNSTSRSYIYSARLILAKIRRSSSRLLAKIRHSAERLKVIFGSMAAATFGSLLFPTSTQSYVLYALYALIGSGAVLHWLWLRWGVRHALPSPSSLPNKRRNRWRVRRKRNLLPLFIRHGQQNPMVSISNSQTQLIAV